MDNRIALLCASGIFLAASFTIPIAIAETANIQIFLLGFIPLFSALLTISIALFAAAALMEIQIGYPAWTVPCESCGQPVAQDASLCLQCGATKYRSFSISEPRI